MSRNQSRLLVAGAINTDLVAAMRRAPEAGETITGSGFAIFGGGKGANQAVAARRFGAEVTMLGAVGEDDFGTARIRDLQAEGIDCQYIAINPELPSGVALIFVEVGGENRIAYVPGATLGISAESCLTVFNQVQPGYLLVPNEVPIDALLSLLKRAKETQCQVILNAAPDPDKVSQLLPMVDILIANRGEAEILAGLLPSFHRTLESLASLGPSIVILTAGADGAYAWHDGRITHGAPPKVDVVDTTGAGDTFCGAFTAALMEGAGVQNALRYGVFASALSVTKPGAQSSIPTRAELSEAFGL